MYRTKDGRQINVRKATHRDIDSVLKLWQALADEGRYIATEHVSPEQRVRSAKSVDDPTALWAMAEINGDLVGSLSLGRYGDLEKTKHLRNLAMGVANGFRGNGVGTALLDYGIKWARRKKVKKIVLSVFSTNKKATGLYQKFGFVLEGTRKKQFLIKGRYVDEIMMGLFVRARNG